MSRPDLRIVSLISSATEIVHALGLGPFQVGRSHECDYPSSVLSLPVCTRPAFSIEGSSAEIDQRVKEKLTSALSIYEVFGDVLERLQPTHILTQTQCKVCAVSLEDVERALANSLQSRAKIVALEPNCLNDIWADIRRVADECQTNPNPLLDELTEHFDQIRDQAHADPVRPRVACIEWHEPLMAAGNWVPELIDAANALNLFGEAGRHSPWMTWGQLAAADPDVIISMPCGFDLSKTESEGYWLTRNPVWHKLTAVRNGRFYITDGNQFMNRPGPRVVESLQILAEILHPGALPPLHQGTAWRQLSATNS